MTSCAHMCVMCYSWPPNFHASSSSVPYSSTYSSNATRTLPNKSVHWQIDILHLHWFDIDCWMSHCSISLVSVSTVDDVVWSSSFSSVPTEGTPTTTSKAFKMIEYNVDPGPCSASNGFARGPASFLAASKALFISPVDWREDLSEAGLLWPSTVII